jgi:hypothetical protein
MKKTNEEKWHTETGMVLANTGTLAFITLASDNYILVTRGWTPEFEDLLREDFLRVLPVGQRLWVEVDDANKVGRLLGPKKTVPMPREHGQEKYVEQPPQHSTLDAGTL